MSACWSAFSILLSRASTSARRVSYSVIFVAISRCDLSVHASAAAMQPTAANVRVPGIIGTNDRPLAGTCRVLHVLSSQRVQELCRGAWSAATWRAAARSPPSRPPRARRRPLPRAARRAPLGEVTAARRGHRRLRSSTAHLTSRRPRGPRPPPPRRAATTAPPAAGEATATASRSPRAGHRRPQQHGDLRRVAAAIGVSMPLFLGEPPRKQQRLEVGRDYRAGLTRRIRSCGRCCCR